jgi:uncharacterized membrane protein YozB (DUF420 family)
VEAAGRWSSPIKIPFNTAYAFVVAVIIFYGFSNTVDGAIVHFTARPPLILYFHVVLSSLWVLLFVAQTALVGAQHSRLHRRIGPWGLGLGAAVVLVGFFTVIIMRQRSVAAHGSSPRAIAFLSITLFNSLFSFAIPFIAAAALRRRPTWHRPLMLIATTMMTMAAQERIPWESGPLPLVVTNGLIIVAAIHDSLKYRRVSPAWLIGIPGIMALQAGAIYLAIAAPAPWVAIASWILRIF